MATTDSDPIAPQDSFPLRPAEIALIIGFWALFGVVTAASRLLDPRGPGTDSPVAVRFAWLAIVEATVWAILTFPLFSQASRVSAEGLRSSTTVLLTLLIALLTAIVANVWIGFVRVEMLKGLGFGEGDRGRGHPPLIDSLSVFRDSVTALGILSAGFARDYSRRYRVRKEHAALLEAQLAEARLDALRRQLDPHFLFNTLNAVSTLVERDPRGVRRMISRLSDLLRFSIEGNDASEIPLEKELDLLQRYLDIMQVRFQGRLDVSIDANADALVALVPSMLLQPIVENAIKHGVSVIEGAGRIDVAARRSDDQLVITVRDNGPGVDDARVEAATGLGLRNTRSRLSQMYGDDAYRFSLSSASGGGAIAELAIPYRTITSNVALPR